MGWRESFLRERRYWGEVWAAGDVAQAHQVAHQIGRFIVRNRTESVQRSQRSTRTEQGGNAVPDSPPAFLPGVCSSTRMAAACTAASRTLCVCTAGSQSAVLMWSW